MISKLFLILICKLIEFHLNQKLPIFNYTPAGIFFWKITLNCILGPPNLGVRVECLVATQFFQVSYDFSMIFIKFFKIPWYFQVFQVYSHFSRFSRSSGNPGVSRPMPGGVWCPGSALRGVSQHALRQTPPADGYYCGQYASYWNAFL